MPGIAWNPADGGPRYVETPSDLNHFSGLVAEPWNTGSAILFIIVAICWALALRGRYRDHPFLTMCLPILATGGVGGVLYHGLRAYRLFFLMDVIPIYILGLTVTIWLWIRLGPKFVHLVGLIGLLALLQLCALFQLPRQWAINVSYGSLAILILTPVVLALVRTRFRYAGWVYTSLACFAIAWIFRISDTEYQPPLLPMGTHWLWHVFAGLTTCLWALSILCLSHRRHRAAETAERASRKAFVTSTRRGNPPFHRATGARVELSGNPSTKKCQSTGLAGVFHRVRHS